MTTQAAVRPAPAAPPLPLESAGLDLARRLAARAAEEGVPAPRVAVIGGTDVLSREEPRAAGLRAAATVHLTADAVLVGPWGGSAADAACGHCLAIRWQRLRTRTERDALETGLDRAAAGRWPVLPEYTADAVWAVCQVLAARPARPPAEGLPQVTRLDLETGRVSTFPLLADPLCPHAPHDRHPPQAPRAPHPPSAVVPAHPAAAPDRLAAAPGNSGATFGRPGVAPARPDVTPGNPDAAPGRPGVASGRPDAAPGRPGVASGRPDAVSGRPGVPPDRPDVASGSTGAVPGHPGAVPAHPVAVPGHPDAALALPEEFPVFREKPAADRYRLRAPGSYGLPVAALANPVCGVLGAGTWSDVTSPTTAPVAGSVFMRGYAGLTDVTWSGQSHSFAASRDLAFLEGLERYAGTHRRDPGGLITDSYANLGDAALDPRDCGVYAPETYATDPMIAPFDPARPIPWVRGWSLRDDRPVLVPARLVYYSAGTAADHFVFECSNGCATGSCLEEAVLFGLLELIERDAFLLGWYGDARLTEIDLGACRSPVLRAMTDRAALCGYDVHAFDNRVDLAVPVVTGLAVRRDGGPGTLAFAAGAAFDPESAVEAAVSEILTYLPHLPRQVTERPAELAAMAEDFGLVRRLPDHAALFGLPRMKSHVRGYLEPPAVLPPGEVYARWEDERPRGRDLREDVLWCTGELAKAGCDVIVVDQTAPEQRRMGLRTVCTIAPGLLPIDFGWARQRALTMPRLRTAQRRAGLRPDNLPDTAIRRVPHPFP